MNNAVRQLAKGSALAFSMMLLGRSSAFILQIMLSRYLGASSYGVMILLTSFARIGQRLMLLGVNQGIVRFGAIYASTQDAKAFRTLIKKSSWLLINLSVVIGMLFWINRKSLFNMLGGDPRLSELLGIAILIMVMLSILSWISGLLQSQKNPGRAVFVREVTPSITRIVVIGAIMLTGGELFAMMWGFASGTAVAMAVGLYYLSGLLKSLNVWEVNLRGAVKTSLPPTISKLLRVSMPMFLSGFSYVVILYFDRFMIAYYLEDTAQVGVYHAAATIAIQMNIVLASCIAMFAPMITEAYQKEDMELFSSLFRSVSRWAFLLSFPLLVIVSINAEFLMSLFGSEFTNGAQLLVILAAAQAYNIFTGPVGIVLQMTGRQKVDLYINLVLVAVNVTLNIMLIPRFGVSGAAFATLISVVLVHSFRLYMVKRALGIQPFDRRLVILGVITAFVLGFAFTRVGELSMIVALLYTLGILLALFFYLYLWGLDEVDRNLVRRATDRLLCKQVTATSGSAGGETTRRRQPKGGYL